MRLGHATAAKRGWVPAANVGLVLVLAGCATGNVATAPLPTATNPQTEGSSPRPTHASAAPCPTPAGIPSVFSVPGEFGELERTTYWVDPDFDPCTQLRVLFTVPAPGWLSWTGSFKPEGDSHVGISIVSVTNLVVDGCKDHRLADPPVGPSVDDLAVALTELGPFVVTSPPTDVTVDGYSGRYLEMRLPETLDVTTCVSGEVISWDAAVLSYPFHGYFPELIEEFWILDVEGSRLVISAGRSPDSPPGDVAEMRELFESIDIEP